MGLICLGFLWVLGLVPNSSSKRWWDASLMAFSYPARGCETGTTCTQQRSLEAPKSFPFQTHNVKSPKEVRTPRWCIFGLNRSHLAQQPSQITYLSICLSRDSVLIDSEVELTCKELVRCLHMACGRCAVRLFHLRPSTVWGVCTSIWLVPKGVDLNLIEYVWN